MEVKPSQKEVARLSWMGGGGVMRNLEDKCQFYKGLNSAKSKGVTIGLPHAWRRARACPFGCLVPQGSAGEPERRLVPHS